MTLHWRMGAGAVVIGLAFARPTGAGAWASVIAAGAAGFLSALHVYWALGGRRGSVTALPQRPDGGRALDPGPLATWLVAAALACVAALALHSGTIVELPWARGASRALTALAALVFVARVIGDFRYVGLFKRVASTPFARWDTRLFTPVAFLLAALLATAAA